MIIHDLTIYCKEHNVSIEDLIFTHRNIDPDEYDVCILTNQETSLKYCIVKNNINGKFMEYFYDDISDDSWIDLNSLFTTRKSFLSTKIPLKNLYFINKRYELKKGNKTAIISLKKDIIYRSEYPETNFSIWNKNLRKQIKLKIRTHIIIANIFIPNPDPDNYKIINHKDKDRSNFKTENLEWCNFHYNNLKDNTSDRVGPKRIVQLDLNGLVIKEWVTKDLFKLYSKGSIYKAIRDNAVFKGYFWKIKNLVLENYLSRHPIDPNGWVKNKTITDYEVYINTCGVAKVNRNLTVGNLNKEKQIYDLKLGNKHYILHRLIYETIHNCKLEKDDTIDHIIPSSIEDINNEITNLRKCSFVENMANPLTIEKLCKKVSKYNLEGNLITTYDSQKQAAQENGVTAGAIRQAIVGEVCLTSAGNFLWCYEGDDFLIKERLKYMYYRFDKDGNLVCSASNFTNICFIKNRASHYRKRFLNMGIPAPDGFYYQQGTPNILLKVDKNPNFKRLREEEVFISKFMLEKRKLNNTPEHSQEPYM